jgi:hypothetical protein
MKYNHIHDVVISADAKGLLEYWSPSTLKFPENEYVIARFQLFLVLCSLHLTSRKHSPMVLSAEKCCKPEHMFALFTTTTENFITGTTYQLYMFFSVKSD